MLTMQCMHNLRIYGHAMNILNTDMKSEFKMFSEIQDRTTVKKAYYLAGADPK